MIAILGNGTAICGTCSLAHEAKLPNHQIPKIANLTGKGEMQAAALHDPTARVAGYRSGPTCGDSLNLVMSVSMRIPMCYRSFVLQFE